MSVQHRDIVDAQRHEPKGISTAGQTTVYVANGTGSGTWQNVQTNNIKGLTTGDAGNTNAKLITDGTNGFVLRTDAVYGSMTITSNTNAIALTAAADATLATNTDYVLLTGTGAPWAGENLFAGLTFTTNRLTVPVTGVYKLDLWSTIIGWPSAAAKVSVKYRINGSTYSTRHPMARAPQAATDPGELSGFGIVALNANDFMQLYVASTVTGNLTFQDVNMSLTLIRQTA